MLGERSDQRGLWEADRLYLEHVGRESFYGLLASLRGRLFRDAEFAEFYCPDNGRDSVPPSLLATALLLQSHDKVSDAEAKARADFDLRWKVALGIEVEDRPFAKSTLQVFRAQLILHDKVREVIEGSLRLARESGYLKRGRQLPRLPPRAVPVRPRPQRQGCGIELLRLGHQCRDPGLVVGDLTPVSPRTDGHIHPGLGHINPYVDTVLLHENLPTNRRPVLARCRLG